jgi:hypothetical protein
MIMLLVQALGVTITPVLRFMLTGFEFLSVGAIIVRITDVVGRPRLVDLAAQRRERWEADHAVSSDDPVDPDDD